MARLIDARYLTSQMFLIYEACNTENIFIDAIIDEIDNAPTVEAVEVVHGRWIPSENGGYHCSVCDKRFGFVFDNYYCPHCGAKMDGDGDA